MTLSTFDTSELERWFLIENREMSCCFVVTQGWFNNCNEEHGILWAIVNLPAALTASEASIYSGLSTCSRIYPAQTWSCYFSDYIDRMLYLQGPQARPWIVRIEIPVLSNIKCAVQWLGSTTALGQKNMTPHHKWKMNVSQVPLP